MSGVGNHLGRRGISMRGSQMVWNTGDLTVPTATTGTDTTPVTTTTYIARVTIHFNTTVTGLSLLNGSAVAGNVVGILYDHTGVPLAQTASTAQAGTAAYQQVPLTTPYVAIGPGLYFIGWQFNNTGARFRSHALGNFSAFTKTGEAFGAATTLTVANTFTANVGPISSTY